MFKKFALLCVMMNVFGCAATSIVVPRLKPAEVNLGPVKKVAIGSIEGDGGEDVSDRLTEAIMASGKYEVLDRKHLAEIERERNIASGDPGAAYGAVLGAAALVFGRVTQNAFSDNVTATEGTCMQGRTKTACTTYTRTAKYATAVNFKIIDAATGKVLATKLVTGAVADAREGTVMEHKTNDPARISEIVPSYGDQQAEFRDAALRILVRDFMKLIAPYTVQVEVVLFEQSEAPTSEAGVNAAKEGDWGRAIQHFKSALSDVESSPKKQVRARALYNLGVAYGYSGEYSVGISLIEKAIDLAPEKEFREQIAVIRGFANDDAKLKAQTP